MTNGLPTISDAEVLAARAAKNAVDPWRPYLYFVEDECSASGEVVPVATIFLTNRECPFRCIYCDLWKNTTDHSIPVGAIPAQIDFALEQLPPAKHIKLYNSGNFFDAKAIPREDLPAIADRVRGFENVIIENHPKLTNANCIQFRDQIGTQLEVAMGLETIHPEVLPKLNKQMTLADFDRATDLLVSHDIAARTFILLKPPSLSEADGVDWAVRSIDHAFSRGVTCCAVIATRSGNGIMEQLETDGTFEPPKLTSLDTVMERGLKLGRGRVFVDVWDVERFSTCPKCVDRRVDRLSQMNLSQKTLNSIKCDQCFANAASSCRVSSPTNLG